MPSGFSPNLQFIVKHFPGLRNQQNYELPEFTDEAATTAFNHKFPAPKLKIKSETMTQLTSKYESMQDLIPVMNKLQDVFGTIGSEQLDLPQIVVVGSQSSGKSSVLENIVQKDFLPRGKDIVTRRPLVLQLMNLKETDDGSAVQKEYAEFLHLPETTFTDFDLVREEIERETERVAGAQKGISREPIYLKIYSPKVLNLTLVDLPGITKVPIGNQPPDIENVIKKLIMEYICKPSAIILAVTPANQDIVNSEAIKLAREVDPEGKRTLGVLSKLDLMDSGTNAYDILVGRQLPLKLGYIGVVNRSQQDIIENKTIVQALKKEEEFFRNHPAYRSISSRCGTAYLERTLNGILINHIKEKIPDLKAKLNLLIVQTEQELYSYGDSQIFEGKAHQGSLVLKLLTKFSNNFNSSIDGTYAEVSTSELCGGARLYYIFNSIFGQSLENIDPCSGLSIQDIKTAIRNSTGPRPSLFIPEVAFDLLIKPQIKRLEAPSLRCVELVFDEMLKIVNQACESKELMRFPRFHHRLMEVVVQLLRDRMAPTQAYIESLISIQTAYINTNHPDFIGGSAAIATIERKHERMRLKEQQKLLKKQQFLANHFPNGPGMPPAHGRKPSPSAPPATGQNINGTAGVQSVLSDPGIVPNGKESGFLTYFFGGHVNGSPQSEGNSRSNSPTRTLDETASDGNPLVNYHSDTPQQNALSSKEQLEVELIRSLIESYFNITRKTITDLVPKTIMHLIVNYAKENIQNRLVTSLYKEDLFAELLSEDQRILQEREKCRALLDVYKRGAHILSEII
jgi:dynamin 1-like protein